MQTRAIPAVNPVTAANACLMPLNPETETSWRARWISTAGPKPENCYFYARRKFTVATQTDQAVLRIAADGRYAAYLNGAYVGNGPARGTHRRYFFDSYHVGQLLKPGDNWLAVELHCCLRPSYAMAPAIPAICAEIEGMVATDHTWQVKPDPSHRVDAPIYTMMIGFSEWKDMRAEPPGWRTGQDRDAHWETAAEVGSPEDCRGRRTVARPISPLTQEAMPPTQMVSSGRVPDAGGALDRPDYAALMADEPHVPSRATGSANLTDPIRPDRDHSGAYLVIDFGREVFGNLVLDVEAPAGAVMDIGHAEWLQRKRLIPTRRHYRFADRFVLRAGRQTVAQRLHCRGFRFIQIVFRRFDAPVRIHSMRPINRIYPQKPRATFSCADPFLNRLWEACARTIRMCCADTFMDCIWREQAFWICDQSVINLFYLALTGDPVFAAHNLRVGADGAMPNGLIPPVYPSQWTRLCPTIPAIWAVCLADYYRYTADAALLRELLPVMEKGLSIYDSWREQDGLIPNQEGMSTFIDWGYRRAGVKLTGKTAALNMLAAAAYKRAAELEHATGHHARARAYAATSRHTVAAVNAAFWDARRGAYADNMDSPAGASTFSQHPLALGLCNDLLEEPQKAAAIAHLLDKELVWAELWYQHYVLQALARHGRAGDAMSVIRGLWQANLEANDDTIWESRDGREAFDCCGSLCHAFSCAPLYFMQSVVLGVRPIRPGFTEFTLAPCATDLDSAQGNVPTPHGLIGIAWQRAAPGWLNVRAHVPDGTRATMPDNKVLEAGDHEVDVPSSG